MIKQPRIGTTLAAALVLSAAVQMYPQVALAAEQDILIRQIMSGRLLRIGAPDPFVNDPLDPETRFYYSPMIGAFQLSNAKTQTPVSPSVALQRLFFRPQAEQVYRTFLPGVSGAILPIDMVRPFINEGLGDAAPAILDSRALKDPWHTRPDERLVRNDFENAWVMTTSAIAPEVEIYRLNLEGQRPSDEALLIAPTRSDFPVLVPTAFGRVLIRAGARAIVMRSPRRARVLNLTGQRHCVIFQESSGELIGIGPGTELVVSAKEHQESLFPKDGIARRSSRHLVHGGQTRMALVEIQPATVLKAAGFSHKNATAPERRIYQSIAKSAAILATMRGTNGFRHLEGPERLVLHDKSDRDDQSTDAGVAATSEGEKQVQARPDNQAPRTDPDEDEINLPRSNPFSLRPIKTGLARWLGKSKR